jgi:HD-GYP domain-containing protein (c-di-GMP phosphodiesterase class II)
MEQSGAARTAGPEETGEDTAVTSRRFRLQIDELLAISRALSSERDIRKLLSLILQKAREITGADAGSVYVVEDADDPTRSPPTGTTPPLGTATAEADTRRLHFMLSQNDSLAIDLKEFRIPVDGRSIVGQAVLGKRPINIADLLRLQLPGENPRGLRHDRSFDDRTGYSARSMLTVPMLSAHDEVMGVVQLINRRRRADRPLRSPADFDENVLPFDAASEQMALALASQAGICLENAILYDEIQNLFSGFVDAAVTAIESRDPTTSGHSRRVATLSVALAERVDALSDGPFASLRFTRDELRQIEYAGVLHDFGKVGVRENVLTKAKKLYDGQREAIAQRFRFIRKTIESEALEQKLTLALAGRAAEPELFAALDRDAARRLRELEEITQFLARANEPALLAGPAAAQLADIANLQYTDLDGTRRPYLEPGELESLRIERGSLTEGERQQIQSHVTHTVSFLEAIPWSRTLRDVPRIAGAHHESMDGRGYPRGLRGDQIPVESRMMTIADIFDALTAADRPYKSAVPVPRALSIIESEVKAGRCDADLFAIFVGAEIYRRVL